jgi:hypothetical protein
MFIQVVEERTDWRGTGLPYPCHELNDKVGDDPGPGHLPSSVQCSKNSVAHGNSNPVRFFRIKDGDEERKDTPMPDIYAVFDGISVLGTGQRSRAILHVFVLPSCQSTTSSAEVVNLPPALLRPSD